MLADIYGRHRVDQERLRFRFLIFFFFSSRRRHTRYIGDWSSDVCSSDWCDFDGTYVRINTARGRVKDRNLKANPVVALSVQDPDNPYRYVQVRGRVAEMTEQGADAHIDALAKKYMGKDKYPNRRPGEVRVIAKITPESVQGMG